MSIESRQLYNFIQGSDISGESAYDIWKRLGNEGTEADFLEFIRSGPKGEKGDSGEAACSYSLESSDTIIKKEINNILLPQSVTFKAFCRNGSSLEKTTYQGRFVRQETNDGSIWTTKYTSSADESSKLYTPSSYDVKIIKCKLYASGGTDVELDSQSVVILSDVENLEIGARNLLSESDITIKVNNISEETISHIDIVEGFDLQRLIGKKVTLSYYADTMGLSTNSDDGAQDSSNKFGMKAKLVWENSQSGEILTEYPIEFDGIGINKERISNTYEIISPSEGYDIIKSFTFDILLTLRPISATGTWVFARPKLEIGNTDTDWSLAPEDVATLTVVLDNDAHTVSTDKDGNNGDFTDCNTSAQVYSGTRNITNKALYEITASEGVTGTWDSQNYKYTVTSLTADNGYVDIKATYRGISVTKRFSLSKSKAGSQGSSGKSAYECWLEIKGNEGKTFDEFLDTLKGPSGESTYDVWKSLGNEGDANDFLEFLKGPQGPMPTLVDNLESTSTTEALTANQGRILNEKIPIITIGSQSEGFPSNPVNNQIHIMYEG